MSNGCTPPAIGEPSLAIIRSPASRRSRWSFVLVCVLLLLAWLLYWRDFVVSELGLEGFLSVDLAYSPISDMLIFLRRDVHPPVFYGFLHAWLFLAGLHYITAKFVPIACGLLALVVWYRLGSRLVNPTIGLIATVLLAITPSYLHFSSSVRDFIAGLLLSLFSLLLTVRLMSPRSAVSPSKRDVVLLAMCTAAALLTWYLHWFFFATEALVIVLATAPLLRPGQPVPSDTSSFVDVRSRLIGTTLALIGGAVLALPWYVYFVPEFARKLATGTTDIADAPQLPTLEQLAVAGADAIAGRHEGVFVLPSIVGWFVVLAIGIVCSTRGGGAAKSKGVGGGQWVLFAGLGLGTIEVAVILFRWQHPGALARYMLPLLPFVVLLQSLAFAQPSRFFQVIASVALAFAVTGQVWSAYLAMRAPIDWTKDTEMAFLGSQVEPGDGIVFSDHARRGQYLLLSTWAGRPLPDGANNGIVSGVIQGSNPHESYLHDTASEARATVEGIIPRAKRIWYVEVGEPADGQHLGRAALAGATYIAWQEHGDGGGLQRYRTAMPDRNIRLNATLASLVTLVEANFTGRAKPGGAVTVELLWRDERLVPAAYTVFVHLDDATGHLVAQHDGTPVAGLLPTNRWKPGTVVDDRHGVELPAELPPGDYRLNVGLYRGEQRLNLVGGEGAIQLGVVTVAP